MTSSSEETMLGVKIDKNLKFDSHIKSLCKKAAQKLGSLQNIIIFTGTTKDINIQRND